MGTNMALGLCLRWQDYHDFPQTPLANVLETRRGKEDLETSSGRQRTRGAPYCEVCRWKWKPDFRILIYSLLSCPCPYPALESESIETNQDKIMPVLEIFKQYRLRFELVNFRVIMLSRIQRVQQILLTWTATSQSICKVQMRNKLVTGTADFLANRFLPQSNTAAQVRSGTYSNQHILISTS